MSLPEFDNKMKVLRLVLIWLIAIAIAITLYDIVAVYLIKKS